MSSNRGEKGRDHDSKHDTEAHQIGRKEMLQTSPFSSIDVGGDDVSSYQNKFENNGVSIDKTII